MSKRKKRGRSSNALLMVTVDESGFVQSVSRVSGRKRSAPDDSVTCAKCGAKLSAKNYPKHLREVHGLVARENALTSTGTRRPRTRRPVPSRRRLVKCPYCSANVREDRLEKHKRKVHRARLAGSQPTSSRTRRTRGRIASRTARPKRRPGSGSSRLSQSDRNKLESLWQSHDEPRDGSKGWGHMRREHGRFGSHPLFDDYGEESEP